MRENLIRGDVATAMAVIFLILSISLNLHMTKFVLKAIAFSFIIAHTTMSPLAITLTLVLLFTVRLAEWRYRCGRTRMADTVYVYFC